MRYQALKIPKKLWMHWELKIGRADIEKTKPINSNNLLEDNLYTEKD